MYFWKGRNLWRNLTQQHSNFGRYFAPNDISSTSMVVSSRTDDQATHWCELFNNEPFVKHHERFKVEISCHLYPCAAKVGPMLMRWAKSLLALPTTTSSDEDDACPLSKYLTTGRQVSESGFEALKHFVHEQGVGPLKLLMGILKSHQDDNERLNFQINGDNLDMYVSAHV